MQRRKVDFPDPEGPMITTTSRGATCMSTPHRARCRPNDFQTPSACTMWRPSTVIDAPLQEPSAWSAQATSDRRAAPATDAGSAAALAPLARDSRGCEGGGDGMALHVAEAAGGERSRGGGLGVARRGNSMHLNCGLYPIWLWL